MIITYIVHYKKALIIIIHLLFFSGIIAAQSDTIATEFEVTIHNVDTTEYPVIELLVSALNPESVQPVAIDSTTTTLTHASQPIDVIRAEPLTGMQWSNYLVILIDLTSSVSQDQLRLQKRLAVELVRELDSNDFVSVIGLYSGENQVEITSSNDHPTTINHINTLTNPRSGTSNQFQLGIEQALDQLEIPVGIGDGNESRMIVVFTDVSNAILNDGSISAITNRAMQSNTFIHVVAFGDADVRNLWVYSLDTDGIFFDVTQEGLEVLIGRIGSLTTRVTRLIAQSTVSVNTQHDLELLITSQGQTGMGVIILNTPPRQLVVNVSDIPINLQSIDSPLAIEVTATYQDTNALVPLASVEVSIIHNQSNPIILVPDDLLNPSVQWSFDDLPSGEYEVIVTVSDVVGNTSSQSIHTEFELPASIELNILDAVTTPNNTITLQQGITTLEAIVSGRISTRGVAFYINSQEFDVITESPYQVEWDASAYTGVIEIVAVAIDEEDRGISDTIELVIELSSSIGTPVILSPVWRFSLVIVIIILSVMLISYCWRIWQVAHISKHRFKPLGDHPLEIEFNPNPQRKENYEQRYLTIEYTGEFAHLKNLRYNLYGSEEISIGRDNDCHVPIPGIKASRAHGKIVGKNNRFVYKDEYKNDESRLRGKTIIDDQEIDGNKSHDIKRGTVIKIGETLITLY